MNDPVFTKPPARQYNDLSVFIDRQKTFADSAKSWSVDVKSIDKKTAKNRTKSWVTGNAMVVRPLDHSLDLKSLEFVFRGGIGISTAITGAAQPQITRTNVSPLVIRFPQSLPEQKRLASTFEDSSTETQRLASLYQQKLAALEALQKSLLLQAFTGEL